MSFVFDNIGTVIFAIFMSLWTRYEFRFFFLYIYILLKIRWFVEFWKRRQAVLQYEWVDE
jgi:hypothetical protein